jgi:hypothetical protein
LGILFFLKFSCKGVNSFVKDVLITFSPLRHSTAECFSFHGPNQVAAPNLKHFFSKEAEQMVICRKRCHDTEPCTRICCDMMFFISFIGVVILCVLAILCGSDSRGIGYCTGTTVGGFMPVQYPMPLVTVLVFGVVIAVLVSVMLFCIGCCKSADENI